MAFHVTCAQGAGLHSAPSANRALPSQPVPTEPLLCCAPVVEKEKGDHVFHEAFCKAHTPAQAKRKPKRKRVEAKW